ncbi:hypothetical protein I5R65_22210 [Herbaspirillum sp. AP02]|uniref:XopAX family type III secretion system effector n=1 Tax=unclassified Herbaspirillum TaxID=2624150 RepID=UPI0015DA2118|nr:MULTISPECIES: XopAX family type III secretion system effector [unclassified Herbaspirillum]MBG7622197.1 hypothetical protein [Herbaspirillum sp. AP02]NZD70431.1 hypothetical protein [Herbaspirillum sp. AP21]
MRITHDDYTPLSLLAEVLSYAPTSLEGTKRFAEERLSNHDYLLPELRSRFEAILNSFSRLGSDTCETQGLDDDGVDLFLKFDDGVKSRRVGFQIKSNREADRDAKKTDVIPESGLLKTLKRQVLEALMSAKVDEWWIMPCFNLKQHKKRLGAINSFFKLNAGKNWPIEVISPEKVLGLLLLSPADVDAICTRILCRDDEVLFAARQELIDLSRPAQKIVYDTFFGALTENARLEPESIFDADDKLPAEELLEELQQTEYVGGDEYGGLTSYVLNPMAFPALCALHFEGRVRHELSVIEADTFMWRLLDDIYPGKKPRKSR